VTVRPRRVIVPALLIAMAVAGCSTTVKGTGSFGGSATASGSASPTPSGSASASATPSSSESGGTQGRSALSCAGGKILQPNGAPYCFVLPNGFKDVSGQTSTTVGQSGEHPASVAFGSDSVTAGIRDLIIVLDFTLRVDSNDLSDPVLVQQLTTLITNFESQGFTFASKTPERMSVDGARGYVYHARAKEGYSSDLIFVFRGTQEVELNCQYKQRQAQIQSACQQILGSLQIKG
jgi:hypothetical protein